MTVESSVVGSKTGCATRVLLIALLFCQLSCHHNDEQKAGAQVSGSQNSQTTLTFRTPNAKIETQASNASPVSIVAPDTMFLAEHSGIRIRGIQNADVLAIEVGEPPARFDIQMPSSQIYPWPMTAAEGPARVTMAFSALLDKLPNQFQRGSSPALGRDVQALANVLVLQPSVTFSVSVSRGDPFQMTVTPRTEYRQLLETVMKRDGTKP